MKYSIIAINLLYKVEHKLNDFDKMYLFQELWNKIRLEKIKQKLI